jgi:peptide/nickel transport system substrate-binding protein
VPVAGQTNPIAPVTPSATIAPAVVSAPGATTAPAPAVTPAQEVARDRTLVLLGGGQGGTFADPDRWNPFVPASDLAPGLGLLYEPLAFYSALADKETLWLAQGYTYNADFTQLTITTRAGIAWSDGAPFSAEDVAHTLTSVRDLGAKVRGGLEVQQLLAEARATGPGTVALRFKAPAPRFFDLLTYQFDRGLPIVPKHVYQGQDWTSFKAFDPAKGLPVTTGPWQVVTSTPERRVLDRRAAWWAATAGLAPLPKVERITFLPFAGESLAAQALGANQIDVAADLPPDVVKNVLAENSKITTFTGSKAPYGSEDPSPVMLYVNCTKPPWDDNDERWATSYLLDRQEIVDRAFGGATVVSSLPLPRYPALLPYFDAVKDLLALANPATFDVQKAFEILKREGYSRRPDGIWADDRGVTMKLDVSSIHSLAAAGPLVVSQLKKQGFDVTYQEQPDTLALVGGDYSGALLTPSASIRDPYRSLRLFQNATKAIPGAPKGNLSKWSKTLYDETVDSLYAVPLASTDKLKPLFHTAIGLWLNELPAIPLVASIRRSPLNSTYWTGWPSEHEPYVNPAFEDLTFQLVLNKLAPSVST